jgi:hypothetical protein
MIQTQIVLQKAIAADIMKRFWQWMQLHQTQQPLTVGHLHNLCR